MDLSKGNINQVNLPSQVFKAAIGERVLDWDARMRTNNQGTARNAKWAGFGRSIYNNLLDWTIRNIGNYILQSALTLYNFDWNQTDAEISQQLKANEQVIATQAGQLSGTTLIYTLGIGFTTKAAMKYPVIAGRTALTVAEEGGEEIRASIRSFLTSTRNATANSLILSTYLSGRTLLFGAQTQKKDPWIASDQLDKIIEKIPDKNIRAYWNGFKDSVEDGIFDLGYIINNGLLESYEINKAAKAEVLGKQRIVELIPDEGKPDEKMYFYGNENTLMPQITQAINTTRLVSNKDMGEFLGSTYGEANHAQGTQRILKIFWSESPTGASKIWKDNRTKNPKISEMKISDVKPGVTWAELMEVSETFTRGNIIVTAFLSNKRQVRIMVANKAEGERIIRKMIALTTATITKFAYSEQDPENPVMKKDLIQMHRFRAILEVKRETAVIEDIKYRDPNGTGYKFLRTKAELYKTEQQNNWISNL